MRARDVAREGDPETEGGAKMEARDPSGRRLEPERRVRGLRGPRHPLKLE